MRVGPVDDVKLYKEEGAAERSLEVAIGNFDGSSAVGADGTTDGISGPSRILPLESLRGLAAISVVFSHFLNLWFPAVSIAGTRPIYGEFESFFYDFPLNALYNCSFAVAIFFVHSGFVLSTKYFRVSKSAVLNQTIATDAKRRLVRLGIPVAVSVWIGFGLHRNGAMDHPWFRNTFSENTWLQMLYQFDTNLQMALFESFPGAFCRFGPHRVSFSKP